MEKPIEFIFAITTEVYMAEENKNEKFKKRKINEMIEKKKKQMQEKRKQEEYSETDEESFKDF